MSAAYTLPEAVCLRCGRGARPLRATLDPTHPMVRCSHPVKNGRDIGCGVQLGTLDITEGAELARWNVSMRDRDRHARHLLDGKAAPACQLCAVDPPFHGAHDHGDRLGYDRFAMFVHLDIHHGDRSQLSGMHRRTLAQLTEVHEMHHGRPFRP